MIRKRLNQYLPKDKFSLISNDFYISDLRENLSFHGIKLDKIDENYFLNIIDIQKENKIKDLINQCNKSYENGLVYLTLNANFKLELVKRFLTLNKKFGVQYEHNNETFILKGPVAFISKLKLEICRMVFYSQKSSVSLNKPIFDQKVCVCFF